jgi:hypothetical protein
MLTTGLETLLTLFVAAPVQPFAPVTVTVYVPEDTFMTDVVAVVVHKYVVPPLAVKVVVPPLHVKLLPVIAAFMVVLVNDRLDVDVQPLTPVTVTVYVPAATVIAAVVAVVDHKYVVPPLAVNVVLPPLHVKLLPAMFAVTVVFVTV